jgi:hypothetical protein
MLPAPTPVVKKFLTDFTAYWGQPPGAHP